MAENTYEHECMRAELLGVEKPTLDEFLDKQKERQEVESENVEIENLKEVELENEQFSNVSGGLHELDGILSATQRKLKRFKASCGSLTNLLKIKLGSVVSNDSSAGGSKNPDDAAVLNETRAGDSPKLAVGDESDLSKALDGHLDKLDSMIEKAENCQYSMSEQNKQMRKFLK